MASYKPALVDPKKAKAQFENRLIIVAIGMGLLFLVLILRLVILQISNNQTYTTLSRKNSMAMIPIEPRRGLIYDRNDELIANNIPVYHLEVTLERAKNFKSSLALVQSLISIDDSLIEKFNRMKHHRRPFEPIPLKLDLTENEIALIATHLHALPGFQIAARLKRHYPYNEVFSHVLGYMGQIDAEELKQIQQGNYAATNTIGKTGIEKYYEEDLHGQVGYQQVEIDAYARIVRQLQSIAPQSGIDLKLTLDAGLQKAAYEVMKNYRGALVAIEPSSGDVLAMVSTPSFNPNTFLDQSAQSIYRTYLVSEKRPLFNRALNGLYPLASTIKPYLALQGLELSIITPSYKMLDPGWFKIPNSEHMYKDWKFKQGGHGWVNLSRAIIVSSDTYFYNLAHLMGIEAIHDILSRFGFGKVTGIDLLHEYPGVVPTPQWKKATHHQRWYSGDTIITGIGQGFFAITPLQMAYATSILANRGTSKKPHLLKATKSGENSWKPFESLDGLHVTLHSSEYWEIVIDAMRQVISSFEGTASRRFGQNAPYDVAGKTGTGQVFSSRNHDQYDLHNLPENLRDHTLFIAFAPSQKPKIALAVILENNANAPQIARKVLDYFFANTKS